MSCKCKTISGKTLHADDNSLPEMGNTEGVFPGDAMHTRREEPSVPAWSGDLPSSASPPEIEAAYFDVELEAWVLSRHADVLAAFHSSSLVPAGPHSRNTSDLQPYNDSKRAALRAETLAALSPEKLRAWRDQLAREANALVAKLPAGQPVDLMNAYARPLCLSLAAMVIDVPMRQAEALRATAQPVSASAAEPYDPALRSCAKAANIELQSCLHSGPETLRDAGFVALSHTMPCLLGNAWFALMQHPQEWSLLHRQPGLTEQAIEELMRYAGLSRILFRRATEDVELDGVRIRKGDRLILRIIAANRDPDRFTDAQEVKIMRSDAGQFTLGTGKHSCAGAGLIRMAAVTITQPLLQRFASAHLDRPVAWQGGAGFRFPSSLWVCLSAGQGSFTAHDIHQARR
jgi:hypothetical protein